MAILTLNPPTQTTPVATAVTSSCGTPVINNLPSFPNNKTDSTYRDALNRAILNTFKPSPNGAAGICSQYVYNIADNFVRALQGKPLNTGLTATTDLTTKRITITGGIFGKGNAKQPRVRSFLESLGYISYEWGNNLSKKDINNALKTREYNLGDIVIYWSNDGTTGLACKDYGHIQLYTDKCQNPYTYSKPQTNWVSSVPDNYTPFPFVYNNDEKYPADCWNLWLLQLDPFIST